MSKGYSKKQIGNKFYHLRKEKELSFDDLSFLIGTTVKKLKALERGQRRPSVNEFLKLLNIFGCTLESFDAVNDKTPIRGKRGYPTGLKRERKPKILERNNAIFKRYLAGESLTSIAKDYDVSYQRIQQIVAEMKESF